MPSQSQSQQLSQCGLELMVIRVAGIESLTRSSFLWLLFPSRPTSHCTIPSYASQRYPCHTLHARSYKKGTDTQRKRKKIENLPRWHAVWWGNYDDRVKASQFIDEVSPSCRNYVAGKSLRIFLYTTKWNIFDKAKYFSSPQNIC